ncbi:tetratricopeptide repeat-containing glycosyltransferase family 2 protein [Bacillus sp. es.036]|uniref:tetratricopeptide repeat-containing glycosyltransferase family 2 protein n=1 Tax=Bacillus sp. es.036 TaxID=1761764 RepID=UPI000BF95980|nr:glycosyltransferase family 2 protein [Bacillus sp. es.036]PFG12721.1 glycosyltransferase involved in cell wall biosynthesis [Bacillus sp. es.036]
MKKTSLSVCMVVCNEEHYLTRCLNSVKNLADEIIIVDTGSTDQTVTIAEAFGATIINYTWNDDFSEARNRGVNEATGDWILILDADEELDILCHPKLVDLITTSNAEGYYLNFINYYGKFDKAHYFTDRACRLFQNHFHIQFRGKIHEEITSSMNELKLQIKESDLTIFHYGYLDDMITLKKKNTRNVRIIEKALQVTPENIRMKYALGVEHLQASQNSQALNTFVELLEQLPPTSDYVPDLLLKTVHLMRLFHQDSKALLLIEQGLTYYPDFPDLLDVKADLHLFLNQYESAKNTLLRSLNSYRDNSNYSSLSGSGSYRSAYILGTIYEKLLEPTEALYYYEVALDFHPAYIPAWSRWVLGHLFFSSSSEMMNKLTSWKEQLTKEQWIVLIRSLTYNGKFHFLEEIWGLVPLDIRAELISTIKPLSVSIKLFIEGHKQEALAALHSEKRELKMEEILFQWAIVYEENQDGIDLLNTYSSKYLVLRNLNEVLEHGQQSDEHKYALYLAKLMLIETQCWKGYLRLINTTQALTSEDMLYPLSHFYLILASPQWFIKGIVKQLTSILLHLNEREKLTLSILLLKLKNYHGAKEILNSLITHSPTNPLPRITLSYLYYLLAKQHGSSEKLVDENRLIAIAFHLSS